jgi:PhoH-like ATPase
VKTDSGNKDDQSKNGGKKTFVLDTNVLIHDYTALLSFEENDVVIPIIVIEELDNLKTGVGLVPYSARKAIKKIWEIIEGGSFEGAPLPGGGILSIKITESNYFEEKNADNMIISCAMDLSKAGAPNVVLISKDTGVRIKSTAMKVPAQDYERDKSSLFQKYGKVLNEGDYSNGIMSIRYKYEDENSIYRLWGKDESFQIRSQRDLWGITPRNKEQKAAADAVTNPNARVVVLTGKAGTGKTLFALAGGISQSTKASPLYERVIVARPTVPMSGYDLGFLPGDLSEKIDPWMKPIYDNLEVLVKTARDTSGNKEMSQKYKGYQYLIEAGTVEIGSIAHMRGRSLPGTYIVIDEAQNLRPLDVKMLVTRLGEGSKIVLTGDLDQIDTPYLDAESNGLAHVIAKAINEFDFCYLDLQKSERSETADRYAKIL